MFATATIGIRSSLLAILLVPGSASGVGWSRAETPWTPPSGTPALTITLDGVGGPPEDLGLAPCGN
jgi:hypothetical protein